LLDVHHEHRTSRTLFVKGGVRHERSQCAALTNGVRDEYVRRVREKPKNPFAAPDVVSRRGGRVKAPLSREAIVREALRELARSGLEGMSLRKVAQKLDTGPASLYAYVEDLAALHALVLDHALGAVDVSGGGRRGWRARLEAILESYARVLFGTRDLARLALGRVAVGPNALRITDAMLALLFEAKLDRKNAAWAVDLFMLYVTAIAADRAGARPDMDGAVAHAIANVDAEAFPNVHSVREQIISGSGEERFAWAIGVLVEGVMNARGPRRYGRQ
jgi:AcrR family transcriptional regulator